MRTPTMYAWLVLLLAGSLSCCGRATLVLVDRGVGKATIVVAKASVTCRTPTTLTEAWTPPTPAEKVAAAAADLQAYIEKMSGAKLPIVGDDRPVPPGTLILVGRSALTGALDRRIPAGVTPARNEEGYLMLTRGNRLLLAGNDAYHYHGTEYAVADFLRGFGVRWYMPGDYGDFVPPRATLTVGPLHRTGRPDFKTRGWFDGDRNVDRVVPTMRWKIRNGINTANVLLIAGDSTVRNVLPPANEANNPLYADVFGKDAQGKPNTGMPNLYSNASVVYAANAIKAYFREHPDEVEYSIGPDDGGPVDFSPETLKHNLGLYYVGGRTGVPDNLSFTEDWMQWVHRVAREVYKAFPDHIITTNGYANRNDPPLSLTPDPKIRMMFAAIWADTMHAFDNPRSWMAQRQGQMIRQWAAQYTDVYMYTYISYMLAGCGAPIPLAHRTAREMPLLKKWGIVGFIDDGRTVRGESGIFPTYLRARMMWDAHLDVKKETGEFFANWYGPAKKPAMAFWEDLEATFETTPWLGHEDRVLPYVYSDALLLRLEADVVAAERLAVDPVTKAHVLADRVTFEHLRAFMAMNRAEFDGNFAEAARQAQRMLDVRKPATALSPFYFNVEPSRGGDDWGFYYWNAVQRRDYYRQLADATSGKTGDLVALLPERVRCAFDPRDDGRYQGWFAPDFADAGWTGISSTMPYYRQMPGGADAGGYPYLGALWYRTEVEIPAAALGRTIKLYCAAIEPESWLWVNGKYIGHRAYRDAYERPNSLNMDVTAALKPGRNVVAIRVDTGMGAAQMSDGLVSRLFLYAPKTDTPISQYE